MNDVSDETKTNVTSVAIEERIQWSNEHEMILISWADKAMCYKWLHSKAYIQYATSNAWYTIPVIIISTLTGTANFAQGRVPIQYQSMYVMLVGALNIIVGIISTIQQFLKITQICEGHRVSEIAWGKFYRNIVVEIAKHPDERSDPKQMIKVCKEEYDRLIETSPFMPHTITKRFIAKFGNLDVYAEISKPEICDVLVPTNSKRNNWNNEQHALNSFSIDMKNSLRKQNTLQNNVELQINMVKNFMTIFNEINNRDPIESEILTNLQEKMDIDTIKSILKSIAKVSDMDVEMV